MIAYKLVRKMNSGEISPLFINKRLRIPLGKWLIAEPHKTKGFAYRKGWHCCFTPYAPHLTEKGRVWVKVEVEDFEVISRPKTQGGKWILANRIKFIEET